MNEVTLGSFMGHGTSLDSVSLSIFDLYHDFARDFGVNLKANMTVKVWLIFITFMQDADIAFDDEADLNMELIKEILDDS